MPSGRIAGREDELGNADFGLGALRSIAQSMAVLWTVREYSQTNRKLITTIYEAVHKVHTRSNPINFSAETKRTNQFKYFALNYAITSFKIIFPH